MSHNRYNASENLMKRAKDVLVGGVNSPVRAYGHVGGTPPFITKASGPYIWDADGNKYIDYVGSWGPAILGHAHSAVVATIAKQAEKGVSFGAPTEMEIELGEAIRDLYPSMEQVRFVNSGTEATMSAIRVARGYTGRPKVIKFDGGYHGHADFLLVKAGSGALTGGEPDSAGVPAEIVAHTLVADYNDLASVEALMTAHPGQVAAVIVEPVAGNMGCVPPTDRFLSGLKKLCQKNGTVLIFDEVMTGFRVALGGAQAHYGIEPDMTCLGKIVGGGLPMAAYGGRREIMACIAPVGPVYQAGTLSGNPLAMAVGLETIKQLKTMDYTALCRQTTQLVAGLSEVMTQKGIAHTTTQVGGMWTLFFVDGTVHNLKDVMRGNKPHFVSYFHQMLDQGIYLAPSPYEAAFVSFAHTPADISATLEAAAHVTFEE